MQLNAVPDEPPPPRAVPPKNPPGVRARASKATKAATQKRTVTTKTTQEIEVYFLGKYLLAAQGARMVGRHMVANQIELSAVACAKADTRVVIDDDSLRKAVEKMMEVSAIGALLTAHLPILMVFFAEQRPEMSGYFAQENLLSLAALLSNADSAMPSDDADMDLGDND